MKSLNKISIEKSRSGVYKDTSENRRLHRVGQRYGSSQSDPKPEFVLRGKIDPVNDKDWEKKASEIDWKYADMASVGQTVAYLGKVDNSERPYAVRYYSPNGKNSDVMRLTEADYKRNLERDRKLQASRSSEGTVKVSHVSAEDLKPGDVVYDWEDVDTSTNIVNSGAKPSGTVKKVTPFKNGFGEVIGAEVVYDDGQKTVHRGTLLVGKEVASSNSGSTNWQRTGTQSTRTADEAKKMLRAANLSSKIKSLKEELDHHREELDHLEANYDNYVSNYGEKRYLERYKKIEDRIEGVKKELDSLNGASDVTSETFDSVMESIADKFFDSKVSGKEKRNFIEKYTGAGSYDKIWDKLNSRSFDSSTDKDNAFMEEVENILIDKLSEKKPQGKPEQKPVEKPSFDEGTFTRVSFPDMPNSGKVNLKKYLSDKRKKAVDDAWKGAKIEGARPDAFQTMYNGLRDNFNNNFDSMSKAERAELLYKILKVKNFMEKK